MKQTSYFFILIIVSFVVIANPVIDQGSGGFASQEWLRNALEWIQGLGAIGAIAFIALYAVAAVRLIEKKLQS